MNHDYRRSLQKSFEESLELWKETDLLSRATILPPKASDNTFQFRSTLKLAVRKDSEGQVLLGLFQPGTHRPVDISSCPLHTRSLQKLLSRLQPLIAAALEAKELELWDEQKQEGDLRYLIARSAPLTEEIQLVFVLGHRGKSSLYREWVRQLRLSGLNIVSAFTNENPSSGNAICSHKFQKIAGQEYLRMSLAGSVFGVSPGSFVQTNLFQAERIYQRIRQLCSYADRGESAWDLYCGMGPISFSLIKQGFKVWGVEENPTAISDAQKNIKRNDVSLDQVDFLCGSVEEKLHEFPEWAANPSLIVVNPSRGGLEASVSEKLSELLSSKKRLEKVFYLSCDLKTLIRDLKILCKNGARLSQVEAFDMFPHTGKFEWLAVITKA